MEAVRETTHVIVKIRLNRSFCLLQARVAGSVVFEGSNGVLVSRQRSLYTPSAFIITSSEAQPEVLFEKKLVSIINTTMKIQAFTESDFFVDNDMVRNCCFKVRSKSSQFRVI